MSLLPSLGGSGSRTAMNGVVIETETFKAKYIVNAAGSYSDKIAGMIGDHFFKIKPRLGDYILLNRSQGNFIVGIVFFLLFCYYSCFILILLMFL